MAHRHSITGSVVQDNSRNVNEGPKKNDGAKGGKGGGAAPATAKAEEETRKSEAAAAAAKKQAEEEEARKLLESDSGEEVQLTESTESQSQSQYEVIMYARRVKRIFVASLTFKVAMLIISACVLGFAAESTPNIDIFDCHYDHRPGFVAFFMVVHAFFFCVMIFLMAYQLFYQLKEKARIPQRVMDLFCVIILIIICSIALACYALWYDDTLSPYYENCQERPLPIKECINPQNCDMFKSMRTMAIGALFWGALLLIFLILGAILLGCVVGKKLMDSPEGKALYKKMQNDSDLVMKEKPNKNNHSNADPTGANFNANSNAHRSKSQQEYEDRELGYGGEGLVLLNFDKLRGQ